MEGFRNNFYKAQIATAAILCVLLAFAFDLVLLLISRLLTPWRRRRAA
jgi:osmoprotectant transport system permease protein